MGQFGGLCSVLLIYLSTSDLNCFAFRVSLNFIYNQHLTLCHVLLSDRNDETDTLSHLSLLFLSEYLLVTLEGLLLFLHWWLCQPLGKIAQNRLRVKVTQEMWVGRCICWGKVIL